MQVPSALCERACLHRGALSLCPATQHEFCRRKAGRWLCGCCVAGSVRVVILSGGHCQSTLLETERQQNVSIVKLRSPLAAKYPSPRVSGPSCSSQPGRIPVRPAQLQIRCAAHGREASSSAQHSYRSDVQSRDASPTCSTATDQMCKAEMHHALAAQL